MAGGKKRTVEREPERELPPEKRTATDASTEETTTESTSSAGEDTAANTEGTATVGGESNTSGETDTNGNGLLPPPSSNPTDQMLVSRQQFNMMMEFMRAFGPMMAKQMPPPGLQITGSNPAGFPLPSAVEELRRDHHNHPQHQQASANEPVVIIPDTPTPTLDGSAPPSTSGRSSGGFDVLGPSTGDLGAEFSRDGRLPMRMTEFSGKSEDYFVWKNRFQQLVLNRKETPAFKYILLLDCIKNVKGLLYLQYWQGTQENLDKALARMDQLFGNATTVLDDMMISFTSRPPVFRQDRVNDLLELQSDFESIVSTAQQYGKLDLYRQLLSTAMLRKLPVTYLEQIERIDGTDSPSLDNISKVMGEKIQAGLRTVRWKAHHEDKEKDKSHKASKGSNTPMNNAYSEAVTCPYADGNHTADECQLSISDKLKAMRTPGNRRCWVCLKGNHFRQECRSTLSCAKCGHRHHTSFCGALVRTNHPRPHNRPGSFSHTNRDQITNPTEQTQSSDAPLDVSNNHVVIDDRYSKVICYKTLVVRLHGHSGSRLKARVLMDDGAGFNFILDSLARQLGLTITHGPVLNVLNFGSKHKNSHSRYVMVKIEGNRPGASITLPVCVVPTISSASYATPPPTVLNLLPVNIRDEYLDTADMPIGLLLGIAETNAMVESHQRLFHNTEYSFAYQTGVLGTTVSGGRRHVFDTPLNMLSCTENILQEHHQADIVEQDKFVSNFLRNHVRTVEGRMEVDVPMTGVYQLMTNEKLSLKQMKNNCERWQKKGMMDIVEKIFQDWKASGIIEEVTPEMAQDHRRHVLSYHVVAKPSSATTKYRVVFNGSLKDYNGNTLNDFLFKGTTTWGIISSFIGFRRGKFTLVGDLRQAFLMVQVFHLDRNMFSFFWPSLTSEILYRFVRVPFGTSASPFLLFVAIVKILELESKDIPEIADLIRRFYVDDLVTSFDGAHARDLLKELCVKIFAKYGFTFGWSGDELTKVLGMDWNPEEDTLAVRIPELKIPNSIRDLASLIPSLYDPLGIIEPVVASLRRVFSKAWAVGKDWDAPVPEDLQKVVQSHIEYLQSRSFAIPRWTRTTVSSRTHLHVFSDANLEAIGTVVYAQGDDSKLRLLFSKSVMHRHRTPAEAELDAILLSAKLIRKHFPSEEFDITLWTDSELNYHRLKTRTANDLKYRQAVKVIQIRDLLLPYHHTICHVPGKINSADLMTKFSIKNFDFDQWISREVPPGTLEVTSLSASVTVDTDPDQCPTNSDTILQEIDQAVSLATLQDKFPIGDIIKSVQWNSWPKEMRAFQLGHSLPPKSVLGNFYYEFSNGLLCTKMRIDSAHLRIVLPASSRLVFLLWQNEHLRQGHPGVAAVRAAYLASYFTPGTRRLFQLWSDGCAACAYQRRRPTRLPDAPLPAYRTTAPGQVFSHIGMDFAGPIGTSDGKRFVLVLNCLHARAVWLKALTSQDANSIHCALRMFVADHGSPKSVYSDNATGFVRANAVISALYRLAPDVAKRMGWKFSFPRDPQSNGATEVMVRAMKKTLYGFDLPQYMTALDLETFLAEAQSVINNRPLFVDGDEVVTPNHFIYGRTTSLMVQPDLPADDSLSSRTHVQIRKKVRAYWNKWSVEYLDHIRDQQLGTMPSSISVNDRVVYKDRKVDQNGIWPTGKVCKVYPGEDGLVRLVDVEFDDGSVVTRRPVRSLVLLATAPGEVDTNTDSV